MARARSKSGSTAKSEPAATNLSARHLAHELNTLLDGAIRSLALAQQALDDPSARDTATIDQVLARLGSARQGMMQIALILDRAMSLPGLDSALLFDDGRTIGAEIQQMVVILSPLAQENDVELVVQVAPDAAQLRSGPLGPIILNGLRNAIQACALGKNAPRRTELSLTVDSKNRLILLISDTGDGVQGDLPDGKTTKADGHGFGLDLCRQIVRELGGDLQLTNVPFEAGAILRVQVPVQRLVTRD
ncbi:MAG: ATP-binding protein [Phycisphaerales bacterium]|nr:ATP-binding protein [Phycisphaerales bacterium]